MSVRVRVLRVRANFERVMANVVRVSCEVRAKVVK